MNINQCQRLDSDLRQLARISNSLYQSSMNPELTIKITSVIIRCLELELPIKALVIQLRREREGNLFQELFPKTKIQLLLLQSEAALVGLEKHYLHLLLHLGIKIKNENIQEITRAHQINRYDFVNSNGASEGFDFLFGVDQTVVKTHHKHYCSFLKQWIRSWNALFELKVKMKFSVQYSRITKQLNELKKILNIFLENNTITQMHQLARMRAEQTEQMERALNEGNVLADCKLLLEELNGLKPPTFSSEEYINNKEEQDRLLDGIEYLDALLLELKKLRDKFSNL